MVKVVVAPDKFRGSLSAPEVAAAVERGVLRVYPDTNVVKIPVADGGEGTVEAALAAGWREVRVAATGAVGQPVHAAYAVKDDTALIEQAQICGLATLADDERDAMAASTYGLGSVIGHALDRGIARLVLAIGGSASTDGGAGMLQALGVKLSDARGHDLPTGGAALNRLVDADVTRLHPRVDRVEVIVTCDVDNPLLGPQGAAAVFGPQKGASAVDVEMLDAGLSRLSGVLAPGRQELAAMPGAGAAGGTAYGALALLGARLEPGIALVLDMVQFAQAAAGAHLVITGEGSIDEQSLRGKVPVGAARVAAAQGVPVVVVAGRSLLSADRLTPVGISAVYPLSDVEPDPAISMAKAALLLEEMSAQLAREQLP
ncbi:MAG: glycerate kinase [Nocardioidaceae bacterium]